MKRYLLTPGPVEMPDEVYRASSKKIIGHRTEEFSDLFESIQNKLKTLLKVETPVVILPSSGTGALECLAVNFLTNKDSFISASCGVFGDRFREIALKTGAKGIFVDFEMGTHVEPEIVKDAVLKHPECKFLLLTQNETSTGVLNDIKKIIAAIPEQKRPLILVDGVSSIGTMECFPSEWGIDGIATASQKGLMTPPGLGIVWISEKAKRYLENNECQSYYFDLKRQFKSLKPDNYSNPYTPPVTLYYALNKALEIILKGGADKWFNDHRKFSHAFAAGIEALGLKMLVTDKKYRSTGVSAISSPDCDTEVIRNKLTEWGITTAGGQGDLKNKIIRIAHYDDKGWPELAMILSTLYAVLPAKNKIKDNFLEKPLMIYEAEEY